MREREPSSYIRIPYQTLIVVLLTLFCVRIAVLISPLVLPIVIAILIAVAAMPAVEWFFKKGLSRGTSVAMVTLILALAIGLICYMIVPTVIQEVSNFVENFPQEKAKLLASMSETNPLRSLVDKGFKQSAVQLGPQNFQQILGAGNVVVSGLTETLLIFVFSAYLLADGPRMVEWLSAFFSNKVRHRVTETCVEASKIVSAYVVGQIITSVLSFVFVFIVLTVLKVPNVFLLASMAGLFDVLPVLGFIMAVIPAMLFALNVSGGTALIVLTAYLFYHAVENYFIVPLIYGNRLRVSGFVVFFALIAAGLATGIEGALAILPIVASYPVIEKIWLADIVRREAIQIHAAERAEDEAVRV